MNFLRNNEVVKTLYLQIFISVSAIVVAFIWDKRFGVFTFVVTTLLLLISIVSTYMRYRRIYELSADVDRILHGNDINLSLNKYHAITINPYSDDFIMNRKFIDIYNVITKKDV